MLTYRHTVTTDQVDVVAHLNNAAYLSIFEAARWDVFSQVGVDTEAMLGGGQTPVIVAIDLSFRREVRLGETVVIHTTWEVIAPRRIRTVQEMRDEAGELRAVGTFWSTFFDLRSRKAIDPPASVLRACGIDPSTVAAEAPAVQGLGGAFLIAEDPAALAAWYQQHLGLEMQQWGSTWGVELPSADRVRGLRLATTTFALFRASGPLPATRTGRVNFRVADLDALVARLAAAGIRNEAGPTDYGRFWWVWDPEGNQVELWEPQRI